jgi:ADP-ribose pyrophosphatase YjhB (NUDIX family)
MTKIIEGERVGKLGELTVGCSAVIFDPNREKILLTRRMDNGCWCLPGGQMNAGESVAEACLREVLEETGLQVCLTKLIGIYSDPNRLVEYVDGSRYHFVTLCFEAKVIDGELRLSNETTCINYFMLGEIEKMDLMGNHFQRIVDAIATQASAFVR